MINIYVSFRDGIFGFFNKDMYKLCKKQYNINFESKIEDADIVFYLFNMGIKNFMKDEFKHFNLEEKFQRGKELKTIKYFIQLKKKIIIYMRSDSGNVFDDINSLIQNFNDEILFIIRDYILKEKKKYNLISNSHYKYLINNKYPKKKDIIIKEYVNDKKKYFCYTIPYAKKTGYGFLGKKLNYDRKRKKIDIFYIKNYRDNTYNCTLRKKILEKLLLINKDKKYKLVTENCSKDIYTKQLLESKIMISPWGIGESLRDDYFCLMNDIIVLKVNTSHIEDFYGLFKKNNVFHFFEVDLSDSEEKIEMIINNYEYYKNLHNERRQQIIKKYSNEFHLKQLADKINQTFS